MPNGTWSLGTPIPTKRDLHGIAAVGTKIYCMGGLYNVAVIDLPLLTSMEIYDTETDSWDTGPDLSINRHGLICVPVGTDIYCMGGYSNSPSITKGAQNINEIYDTKTGTWRLGKPMPTARFRFSGVALGTKIYCLGGAQINRVEIYDTVTDSWTIGPSTPALGGDASCAVYRGEIYCIANQRSVYIYTPQTNSWRKGTDIPETIEGEYLNGRSCVISGHHLYYPCAVGFCLYNLQTQQWSLGPTMPHILTSSNTALVGKRIFYIGGRGPSTVAYNQIYTLRAQVVIQHHDTEGTMLSPEEIAAIEYGDSCTATAESLEGYLLRGYYIDSDLLQTGSTVTIENVQADHTITFVYEEDKASNNWPINQSSRSFSAPVPHRPLGENITMTGYDIGVYDLRGITGAHRWGGIYDGADLWLTGGNDGVPLTRIHLDTMEQTDFSTENGDNGNSGLPEPLPQMQYGVYDGKKIWPTLSGSTLVELDTATGTLTGHSALNGVNVSSEFASGQSVKTWAGIYDGHYVWMNSRNGQIIRIDPDTAAMTGLDVPMVTHNTAMVYDGANIWIIPNMENTKLTKIQLSNMAITEYPWPKELEHIYNIRAYFFSGAFDGKNLWMLAYNGDQMVKYDIENRTFQAFPMKEGVNGNSNMGEIAKQGKSYTATFDGRYIWMAPLLNTHLIRLDTQTGTMKGFEVTGEGISDSGQYPDICFDGKDLWLIPYNASALVRVSTADEELPIITERYLNSDGTEIYPATYQYLNPGDDYEKTAPRLEGYKRIGHRIDDGGQMVTRIAQIENVQDDHQVTFLYEPCDGEKCQDILITESYYDVENNQYIQPGTYQYLNPGDDYEKTALSLTGYIRIGHRIDNGEDTSDLTASIVDVQDDHHVTFLYEPDPNEPKEYVKITESYYDTVNEVYVQPDTGTTVPYGSIYSKTAPELPGYKRTGHSIGDGPGQASITATIEAVTESHHVIFLYEPKTTEPEKYVKITESYYDTVNEEYIKSDTHTTVRVGGTYTKAAPAISGYKRTGHSIDDGPGQPGITAVIETVTEPHHVTFLYEPLDDGEKDPKHIITECYFDAVNEKYIQPDTFTLVNDGAGYLKTAPLIAGYHRVAHSIDGGNRSNTLTAQIPNVVQDHQVTFLYEPVEYTGNCKFVIIESYYDTVNGVYIRPDTYTLVRSGRDYSKLQPTFTGYKRTGHRIDGGPVNSSFTAVIRDVTSSHYVVFQYEPLDDPEKPDPNLRITESYYDVENQQFIRLDTHTLVGYGSDYSKTAPGISGYKRVGHNIDEGQNQADFTARITHVVNDHHVTFLYEPVEEETEQELLIRESYYDIVNEAFIQADTYTKVSYGGDYIKTSPAIGGYKRIGHSVDGGTAQASLTASLTNVIHDHHVLFLYEPAEEEGEQPLTITEAYYDVENEKYIRPDTFTTVDYGADYAKTAPAISGYERIGHSIDEGEAQSALTASIRTVMEAHHITFRYKPVTDPTTPDPEPGDPNKDKECTCMCNNTCIPTMGCMPMIPVMPIMMPVMPMMAMPITNCMPGWNWNNTCKCSCNCKDGGGGTTTPTDPGDGGDNDGIYTITEHYIDRETNKAVRSQTVTTVKKSENYSKSAPDVADYVKVGHAVDRGGFSANLTASIQNVTGNHDVYFYYEGDDCA